MTWFCISFCAFRFSLLFVSFSFLPLINPLGGYICRPYTIPSALELVVTVTSLLRGARSTANFVEREAGLRHLQVGWFVGPLFADHEFSSRRLLHPYELHASTGFCSAFPTLLYQCCLHLIAHHAEFDVSPPSTVIISNSLAVTSTLTVDDRKVRHRAQLWSRNSNNQEM